MTHLARADERDQPMTGAQIENSIDARGGGTDRRTAPGHQHRQFRGHARLAARAWRLGAAGTRVIWCLALCQETAAEHGLRPAMTLETTVLTVREVKRGETVSYAGA
jgi:alanine racemase